MIIGIAGKGGSGKTLVAKYITITYEFFELNFADPLKEAAAILVGEEIEFYYDEETKKQVIRWLGITRRELLQKLGTDCVRNIIHPDFWTLRMKTDIRNNAPNDIVIGDVRFKNEAQMIKDLGGKIILLEREEGGFESDHPSEVIDFEADFVIKNDGTMTELFCKVNRIMEEVEKS